MDRESGLTDLFRGALSILEFENSLIVFDEINPFEIKNVKQYFEMNDDCFFGFLFIVSPRWTSKKSFLLYYYTSERWLIRGSIYGNRGSKLARFLVYISRVSRLPIGIQRKLSSWLEFYYREGEGVGEKKAGKSLLEGWHMALLFQLLKFRGWKRPPRSRVNLTPVPPLEDPPPLRSLLPPPPSPLRSSPLPSSSSPLLTKRATIPRFKWLDLSFELSRRLPLPLGKRWPNIGRTN